MSCTGLLPYYPLSNDGVRDARKINADLCALVTGLEAIGTGETGAQGATGLEGATGLANWLQESSFPTGMELPCLLWNINDEALYAYLTGPDRWIQISAGSMRGASGEQGVTGLANWMQESTFPTGMDVPVLLWNFTDEALYAYCTGPDRYVQISAGSQAGAAGTTGLANFMQETNFPTGMSIPVLLWNNADEALYSYVTGPDRWIQISAGSNSGASGTQGVTGLANFMQEALFPTGMEVPVLLWNTVDEALYTYCTGPDRWVQISAGSMQGATGLGVTGLANWIQEATFPTGMTTPILLWSLTDEALYAFCTGPDRWVQMSAGGGMLGVTGEQGSQGETGLANWMQESDFPTGMGIPVLLWNFTNEALYAYCTGVDRWVQISAANAQGETGDQGETGIIGPDGGVTGMINFILRNDLTFIASGNKGDIRIPFDCYFYEWTVLGDTGGSCEFSLWKDSYNNYPPTVADKMEGSTGPYIKLANKNTGTMSGWDSATGAGGDIIRTTVKSGVTGLHGITLSLAYMKT